MEELNVASVARHGPGREVRFRVGPRVWVVIIANALLIGQTTWKSRCMKSDYDYAPPRVGAHTLVWKAIAVSIVDWRVGVALLEVASGSICGIRAGRAIADVCHLIVVGHVLEVCD